MPETIGPLWIEALGGLAMLAVLIGGPVAWARYQEARLRRELDVELGSTDRERLARRERYGRWS